MWTRVVLLHQTNAGSLHRPRVPFVRTMTTWFRKHSNQTTTPTFAVIAIVNWTLTFAFNSKCITNQDTAGRYAKSLDYHELFWYYSSLTTVTQEEWEDRKWCLECQGSEECRGDDYLWVKKCDDDPQQVFFYEPVSGTGGGRLRPYGEPDLCWERTRVNARQLRPCRDDNTQIIKGIEYDGPFEMVPYGESRKDECLTQHHHPKNEEIVRGELCKTARAYDTSLWIMINKRTCGDSGGDSGGGGGGGGGSGGSDTVNNMGGEYCDSNTCGKCEGDCDNDSQCRGDLRCFMRSGFERVPGCEGSTDSHGTF